MYVSDDVGWHLAANMGVRIKLKTYGTPSGGRCKNIIVSSSHKWCQFKKKQTNKLVEIRLRIPIILWKEWL